MIPDILVLKLILIMTLLGMTTGAIHGWFKFRNVADSMILSFIMGLIFLIITNISLGIYWIII
jgi:hypothetical protein